MVVAKSTICKRTMQHPVFRHYKQAVLYFLIWLGLAVAQSFILIRYYGLSLEPVAAFGLIYYGLFSVLGLGLWYPVRFIYQSENRIFSRMINLSGLAIGSILFIVAGSRSGFRILFPSSTDFSLMEENLVPLLIALSFLLFLLLLLGYYLVMYFTTLANRKLEEEKLKSLVRESELHLLKYQMNPHFLFNSLNSISALTISQPAKAQEMIIKLSDYLRYSLESFDEPFKTLNNELNNIHLYIGIEKIRFDKRIKFSEQISEECLEKKVPGMILQPLIENAIKHGVQPTSEKVGISLECFEESGFLIIILQNSFEPEQVYSGSTGTGLENVKKRMETLYNRNDLVEIQQKDTIFEVKLKIPLPYEQPFESNDH